MPLGDLLAGAQPANPVDPSMGMQAPQGPAAPTNPQGVEENKSKWKVFLEKMKEPNFRQAAMQTGLGLMRTPQVGQSNWDVASTALGSGVNTLSSLREADRIRALETQDREIAEQQRTTENELKGRQVATGERQAGTGERNAEVYEQQVTQQGESSTKAADLAKQKLDEAIRSNKSQEEIARLRAQADLTRAKAYSTGGGARTAADIQKIQMLSLQYQTEGMDEVSANARATQVLELGGRGKTPGEQARLLYQEKVKAHSNTFEGMKAPPTKEQLSQMFDEAMSEVAQLQRLDSAAQGPTKPVGEATGVIDRSPTGGPVGTDPGTMRKVEMLKSKGTDPGLIRQALIDEGLDPALYGY